MSTEKKYDQLKMVNWYRPSILASTALRALISGTFANYADKRELEAALDPEKTFFDHSVKKNPDGSGMELNEIWIDYISDTGDGFNSTYTVASLAAKNLVMKLQPDYKLAPDKKSEKKEKEVIALKEIGTAELKTGDLLILGGDQVYPTPSRDQYSNRFKIPFSAAHNVPLPLENERSVMYAIPGNHDWYDGLTNFMNTFAQRRWIGNWITKQKRSYFAIKLPHDFWLWGIDIQLNSYIDEQQKAYFEEIAIKYMAAGSKVILCTAEPSWVYKQVKNNDDSYKRLKYFEQVYITSDSYKKIGKEFKLVATLTGDLHHYSRYSEERMVNNDESKTESNHLITAGGGGAFMHTTHMLPKSLNKITEEYEFMKSKLKSFPKLEMTFPTIQNSRNLMFGNLIFPWFNKFFCMLMGVLALLFMWNIAGTNYVDKGTFLSFCTSDYYIYTITILSEIFYHPSLLIMSLLVLIGFMLFTDVNRSKWWYVWGFIHGKLHLWAIFFSVYLAHHIYYCCSAEMITFWKIVFSIICGFLSSAILNGLFMGIYLFISGYFFDIHINEASSSLSYQHYKNFLRLHIDTNGILTIYPVGIKKVVTEWKQHETGQSIAFTSDKSPEYYLIEPPIII